MDQGANKLALVGMHVDLVRKFKGNVPGKEESSSTMGEIQYGLNASGEEERKGPSSNPRCVFGVHRGPVDDDRELRDGSLLGVIGKV